MFRKRTRLWKKTSIVAILILTIVNSTVQASDISSVSASGQAKQLTAENAKAFLQQFFTREEMKAQLSVPLSLWSRMERQWLKKDSAMQTNPEILWWILMKQSFEWLQYLRYFYITSIQEKLMLSIQCA
ncbi:hypothetical protein [Fontibacillus phaseoli]|nr:hypothetical protein [Fontibacillus phaseoli]